MFIPLVDLNAQNKSILPELSETFQKVAGTSAFINGPFLAEFEKDFSQAMGSQHTVGVGSGTAALWLAFKALGLKAGDEVLMPANTFVATAEAVVACGAVPVFVDICEEDFHLNPDLLASAITSKTKILVPVHLYGLACDMDPLVRFAKDHDLALVNDAAQAHLATYQDQAIGTYGQLTCWSFYPGKNLGALGDGGAVTGDDENLCHQVRLLANHGSLKKYHHELPGFTERLHGLQAAFLSIKLKHLQRWTQLRQEKAAAYDGLLEDLSEVIRPKNFPRRSHVYHLYVIRVPNRDAVLEKLNEAGIGAGIHYPFALTQTESMKPWARQSCPVAEKIAGEILSLPLFPEMTQDQQEFVADTLKKAI